MLHIRDITKSVRLGKSIIPILKGVTLSLSPGHMVGLMGQSGAGKSTLLHIVGLLDAPSSGKIFLQGEDITHAPEKTKTFLRGHTMGFVYQSYRLLPDFSALENIAIPMMILGKPQKEARDRAGDLLHQVELYQRKDHRPAQLSGGEQQRVALARALGNKPRLLLADEPTGNLDSLTAQTIFQLLIKLCRQEGVAALIATHNLELAGRMDSVVTLKDGTVTTQNTLPTSPLL